MWLAAVFVELCSVAAMRIGSQVYGFARSNSKVRPWKLGKPAARVQKLKGFSDEYRVHICGLAFEVRIVGASAQSSKFTVQVYTV